MPDLSLSSAVERLNRALAMLDDSVKSLEQRLNDGLDGDGIGERESHLRAEVSAVIAELDALLDRAGG